MWLLLSMWAAAIDCLLLSIVMRDAAPRTQHAAVPDGVQAAPLMSASCLLNILLGAAHQSGQHLAEVQRLTAQHEPLANGVRHPKHVQNRYQAEFPPLVQCFEEGLIACQV